MHDDVLTARLGDPGRLLSPRVSQPKRALFRSCCVDRLGSQVQGASDPPGRAAKGEHLREDNNDEPEVGHSTAVQLAKSHPPACASNGHPAPEGREPSHEQGLGGVQCAHEPQTPGAVVGIPQVAGAQEHDACDSHSERRSDVLAPCRGESRNETEAGHRHDRHDENPRRHDEVVLRGPDDAEDHSHHATEDENGQEIAVFPQFDRHRGAVGGDLRVHGGSQPHRRPTTRCGEH